MLFCIHEKIRLKLDFKNMLLMLDFFFSLFKEKNKFNLDIVKSGTLVSKMHSRTLRMKDSITVILKRIDFLMHSILETLKKSKGNSKKSCNLCSLQVIEPELLSRCKVCALEKDYRNDNVFKGQLLTEKHIIFST